MTCDGDSEQPVHFFHDTENLSDASRHACDGRTFIIVGLSADLAAVLQGRVKVVKSKGPVSSGSRWSRAMHKTGEARILLAEISDYGRDVEHYDSVWLRVFPAVCHVTQSEIAFVVLPLRCTIRFESRRFKKAGVASMASCGAGPLVPQTS